MNDPGIILFGKKIGLPETTKNITNLPPSHGGHDETLLEERSNKQKTIYRHPQTSFTPHDEEKKDEANREDELELDDNPKTPSVNEEGMPEKPQTEGDSANSQPKTLKKPNKIIPCPRCDSMNTKFCYYNNSNINQPRHYCKSCQRYWTNGGTMRNMPVGAGRRKKKHCRLIISQEAFGSPAAPQIEFSADSDRGVVHPPKVLSFGSNSAHVVGANLSVASGRVRENGDDCSSGSTVITSNSMVEKIQDNNGFHPQVHWIPGASWSYNSWNTTAIPMPIPAICPPGYHPMPIYPSPYWSSGPWLHPAASATNFSILGKHSTDREESKQNEEPKRRKNSVLIPKTLRIDDPDEAAKSSIWATLGIKKDNSSRGDLFKAFQEKGDEKKQHPATEPSPVLQANPAAFSRSLCFQERA